MPIHAFEIGFEEADGAHILVFKSDKPIIISSYVVELNYCMDCGIDSVESIEPFMIVANIQNAKGYTRIASSSGISHSSSNSVPLAKIFASGEFTPDIIVEELYDENLNLIMGDVHDELLINETCPTFEMISSLSPSYQQQSIPQEIRVSWSLPTEITVTGTMPIVTHKEFLERVDVQPESTPIDQTMLPSRIREETTNLTQQHNDAESAVEKTPITLFPLIGGIIVAMLIIRKRL
jgi:hypothetical protein